MHVVVLDSGGILLAGHVGPHPVEPVSLDIFVPALMIGKRITSITSTTIIITVITIMTFLQQKQ